MLTSKRTCFQRYYIVLFSLLGSLMSMTCYASTAGNGALIQNLLLIKSNTSKAREVIDLLNKLIYEDESLHFMERDFIYKN
ncbi:MAG: hypothetical protein AAF335_03770, partial [Bacteroidota bacterium]